MSSPKAEEKPRDVQEEDTKAEAGGQEHEPKREDDTNEEVRPTFLNL